MIIIFVAECNPSYQISFICFFNASKLQHKETKKKHEIKIIKNGLIVIKKLKKKTFEREEIKK